MRRLNRHAELKPASGGLAFYSDYDPALVAAFKALVPYSQRRWDAANRRWLITEPWGQPVAELVGRLWGIPIQVPNIGILQLHEETRILRVEYIGRCKDRGGDERSAFGYVAGGWSAIFPEPVLMRWFDTVNIPGDKPTLYATLGIRRGASASEVKTAFRRMARQWHPDVCKEPNAHEAFIAIKQAYDILSDVGQRARYDAGLQLEASLGQSVTTVYNLDGYRTPLRCGYLLCVGLETLGRFTVSEILQWEDISDDQGRVMVVSWPAGADAFVVDWN